MNWLILISVWVLSAGLILNSYHSRWIFKRVLELRRELQDVANDVADLYLLHGITPPAVDRYRLERQPPADDHLEHDPFPDDAA